MSEELRAKIFLYTVFGLFGFLVLAACSLSAGGKGATSEFEDVNGHTVSCYHPERGGPVDCERK